MLKLIYIYIVVVAVFKREDVTKSRKAVVRLKDGEIKVTFDISCEDQKVR